MSKHPRRESPAKAARAHVEARTQAKAARAQAEAEQAQADLAEAKVQVAKEQDAAIARALQEDEAHRQADLKEVAEKEAEAVRTGHPTHRPGEDLAERGSQDGPGWLVPAGCRQAMNRSGRTRIAPSLPICRWRCQAQHGSCRSPSRWPIRSASSGRLVSAASCLAARHQAWPSSLAISRNRCRREEVLDRAAVAVFVLDPGVRERSSGAGGRLIEADVAGWRGRGRCRRVRRQRTGSCGRIRR